MAGNWNGTDRDVSESSSRLSTTGGQVKRRDRERSGNTKGRAKVVLQGLIAKSASQLVVYNAKLTKTRARRMNECCW